MRLRKSILICAISILSVSINAEAETFNLDADVVALADKYQTDDVPSELIQAVIWTESRGKPDATNGINHGLMQLHQSYFTGDLFEPENNVRQGADYLQRLFDTYHDVPTVLMTYHGEGNVLSKVAERKYSYYATSIMQLAEEIRENRTSVAGCGGLVAEPITERNGYLLQMN